MRDNEHHRIWPIFGGMWGIKNKIHNIRDMISEYPKVDRYALDMDFLRDSIWSNYKEDSLSHVGHENCVLTDRYCGRNISKTDGLEFDFPGIRKNGEFVGMRYGREERY